MAIFLVSSIALAGGTALSVSDPYVTYYPIVAVVLGLLGALVRGQTLKTGFWHTWYGHALLVLIGALTSSLLPLFQSGHVTKSLLISAIVGGVSTFGSAFKTTGKDGNTTVDSAAVLAAKAPPAPPTRPAMLLPLLLLPLLGAVGCVHVTPAEKAFGASYAACMEAKGLALVPSVGATVYTDLNGGTNTATIIAQLEALAKQAGIDAVACATQSWQTQPVMAEKNPAGVAAAKQFLAMHGITS